MPQIGYQEGSELMWWWKVAMHLDEAQLALANAMAHNLDDQKPVFALQDRLREGQAMLLEIFRAKGLLPAASNGAAAVPPPPAGIRVPQTIVTSSEVLVGNDVPSSGLTEVPQTMDAAQEAPQTMDAAQEA